MEVIKFSFISFLHIRFVFFKTLFLTSNSLSNQELNRQSYQKMTFSPYFAYLNILLIRGKGERQLVYCTLPQNAGVCISMFYGARHCAGLWGNYHKRNPDQQYNNSFAKKAVRTQRRGQFFLRHLGCVSMTTQKFIYLLPPEVSNSVFNNFND